MNNIQKAAKLYLDRQARRNHPDGTFDKAGRWYPDETEKCECCDAIRSPSRSYPYSLMMHCRTIRHIANLYNVDSKELSKEIKKMENE